MKICILRIISGLNSFFIFSICFLLFFTRPALAVSVEEGVAFYVKAYELAQHKEFEKAEKLYHNALEIFGAIEGKKSRNYANTLNSLGEVLVPQGRYLEAESLHKNAIEILEKLIGKNHLDVAQAANNLGLVYLSLDNPREAELYLKRSLAIKEAQLGPKNIKLIGSLYNLSTAYEKQYEYEQAEQVLKRAIEIEERKVDKNQDLSPIMYKEMARIRRGMNDKLEGERLFRRAILAAQRSNNLNRNIMLATILNDFALANDEDNKYPDAKQLIEEAIILRKKFQGLTHPETINSLNNLGLIYLHMHHYKDAEIVFREVLDQSKFKGNESQINIAEHNLAGVYQEIGRCSDAIELYNSSINYFQKNHDYVSIAKSLNNISFCFEKLGRFDEAEASYKKVLDIIQNTLGAKNKLYFITLNNLASFYETQSRHREAVSIYEKLIENGEIYRSVAYKVLYSATKNNQLEPIKAFELSYAAQQISASNSLNQVMMKVSQRYASGTSELGALIKNYQDLDLMEERTNKALIDNISKYLNDDNKKSMYQNNLSNIEKKKSELSSEIEKHFPDFVALTQPKPVNLEQTQKLLEDDESVLILDIGQESYVWIVTKNMSQWNRLDISAEILNAEVAQLRESLKFEDSGKFVERKFDTALAFKVYQQIFGPIANKISGKKRISIIANGALTSLPFSILVTKDPTGKSLKDVDWLINSYAVTVIPSIYSLKTMRAQAGFSDAQKSMVAFADPIFSKAAKNNQIIATRSILSYYDEHQIDIHNLAEHLSQLPSTRDEVLSIAKMLGTDNIELYFGLDATETTVKKLKLNQYRIIYFATHGLVAGDLEKFSKEKAEPALALTMPDKPTDNDDGLLQASEITQLKLDADWAVLSACNTASSEGIGAEALSGLARAFLYAGARSLVVSHWEVSDEATKVLMTKMFEISIQNRHLSHGEVMQQAILKIISDAKTEEEAHPKYWGPFVIVGEPARM